MNINKKISNLGQTKIRHILVVLLSIPGILLIYLATSPISGVSPISPVDFSNSTRNLIGSLFVSIIPFVGILLKKYWATMYVIIEFSLFFTLVIFFSVFELLTIGLFPILFYLIYIVPTLAFANALNKTQIIKKGRVSQRPK